MRIHLDDSVADPRLAAYLVKLGHDVELPSARGITGVSDTRHLIHAISDGRTLLTADTHDFSELHDLVKICGGSHPGILLVHRSNDPTRNVTPRGIGNAIAKLQAAAVPIPGSLYILNHWL